MLIWGYTFPPISTTLSKINSRIRAVVLPDFVSKTLYLVAHLARKLK